MVLRLLAAPFASDWKLVATAEAADCVMISEWTSVVVEPPLIITSVICDVNTPSLAVAVDFSATIVGVSIQKRRCLNRRQEPSHVVQHSIRNQEKGLSAFTSALEWSPNAVSVI